MRNANRTAVLLTAGLLGLSVFFSHIGVVHAANACISAGTGNWSAAGTWTSCGGGIPTAADSVTILTGHIVTVDTAAVANTVTINANAAAGGNGISINTGRSLTVTGAVTLNIPTAATTDLNVNGGTLTAGSIAIPGSATANRFATVSVSTGTVTVSGSITFSGSAARARYTSTGAGMTNIGGDFGAGGTLTTGGTGTFNFNGPGGQVIGAYATYNNVQINNTGGGVTFGGTGTIGGTLLVNMGTLDMGGVSLTVTGATTINSTLKISSVTGTKTFGDITIANGGSWNFTVAEGVTLNGNLTVNGTGATSGTTGTFVFQKVGGGAISGTTSGTLTVATANFNTNYSNSISFAVTGVTTVGAGITLTNTGTFTAIGALNGTTGTFTQGTNGILNIGLTSAINALNATASPNEVHYIRTSGAQTIKGTTYHHLFIEESGQVGTLGGAITVNGNLTVVSGTLADSGFQITGNASGVLSVASGTTLILGTAATATAFPTGFTTANINFDAASTVTYNSNQAQTISSVHDYGNLTLTATAAVTKTAAGNLTVNGVLTNGANNVLADGGFVITLKDGCVMTGTHAGSGKILFTGGSAIHTISGAGIYHNVELNDGNGASQSGTTNIGGTLTITGGSWATNGNTLAVSGDTIVNGTISVASTAGTKMFGNLTINTGGSLSFTASEAVTVNGDLMVNGTGTVTGATGAWTFSKAGGGAIGGTAPSLTISGNNTFAANYSIRIPYTAGTMTISAGVNVTNFTTMTLAGLAGGSGTFTQTTSTALYLNGGGATIGTLDASADPNEVHYTSTAAGQGIKAGNYYHLFIDKVGQTGSLAATTTNVLGNLTVAAGALVLGGGVLNVSGTTDIYGTLNDSNNTGSATFGGLVTVHAGGSWTGNAGEACDFNFQNGFIFNGASFVTGAGLYTFLANDQSIAGSSPISVQNLVVTGIQLTNNSTAPLTIGTALSGTGEFIQGPNTILNIGGTSTIATLTATANGNSVNYNGSAAQTLQDTAYGTLDVSGNTSGRVTIATDTTASTTLVLGATILSTGSSKMILGPGAALSRTAGFIDGNLEKNFLAGPSSTQTFEVGSGIDYAPVRLSFNAAIAPGGVIVHTTANDHPNIATSHLAANKTVNRFYSVSAADGIGFDTYNAAFTFVPTDVDPGASIGNFVLAEFASGTWSRPTLDTITATSVSAMGAVSFGDFQIGEPAVVPSTLVDTAHADGSFGAGEVIDLIVQYASAVTVGGGTPSLALNSGGTALYASGSGTDTLTFRYAVLAGENSADLDYASTTALSLNGATIKDTGGGDANITLPSVGTFSGAHAIVIDTALNTLHIVSLVANVNGGTATSFDFIVHVKNASSSVDVPGSPTNGTSTPGTLYSLDAGTYTVSENANAAYTQSFGGDCDPSGKVMLSLGADKTCTVTNTDIPAAPPAPVLTPTPAPASLPPPPPVANAYFYGQAYPGSSIKIFRKSGVIGPYESIPFTAVAIADDGKFQVTAESFLQANYFFAVQATDKDGRESRILPLISQFVPSNSNLTLRDILVPPTTELAPSVIPPGRPLKILGSAAPSSVVEIWVDGAMQGQTISNASGVYIFATGTSRLALADHAVKARFVLADGTQSDFSLEKIVRVSTLAFPKTDLNGDGAVNTANLSIFLSRWGSAGVGATSGIDFNGDGKVDVSDLSILLNAIRLR